MSKEANLVNGILRAGCTVELDIKKWSSDSLRSFVTTAKLSSGKVILRNLTGLQPGELDEIAKIAAIGGSCLHIDFSR